MRNFTDVLGISQNFLSNIYKIIVGCSRVFGDEVSRNVTKFTFRILLNYLRNAKTKNKNREDRNNKILP